MKFKRILAVLLSALMLTSMASFTVSANDAELMAEPILAFTTATNQGALKQNERGIASIGYDAENDIVYTHVVPNFESTGSDNSIYINMYGIPAVTPSGANLYVVCYVRSNLSTTNAYAGFYGGLQGKYTGGSGVAYDGSEEWAKQIFTINIKEDAIGTASSTHAWIRPIGENKVHLTQDKVDENGEPVLGSNGKPVQEIIGNAMAEDAYYDVAGVALFASKEAAEAYDIVALSSGKITISFDANGGEGEFESYDVTAGKYAASNVVFPEEAPTAPEGMEFAGWATEAAGSPITGDVATPDVDTTYYAQYKYADQEGVEYDDIYLQNVYSKLYNDKSLTIGYLGGSVTDGAGATVSGPKSTTAWRALTTQWFKDNFPGAAIKEVYGGIGGTGSRFGSYRMTRDLDLANNTLDLLFVDSCVNDQYEGFSYSDKEDLWSNDAVIVAKALANNPKCQIVFVNVCNNGTILSADDSGTVKAHREFADANGFEFIDFKVGMARELMGDDTAVNATQAAVNEKWSTYFTDSVHPADAGYKVYFEYLRDELLNELVDEDLTVSKAKYEDTVPADLDVSTVDTNRFCGGTANSNSLQGLATIKNYISGQDNGFIGGNAISALKEGYSTTFKFTGTNAYIWANKHSHNALLDVYVNDNVNIGSPDYTIDMWRNQESGQSFMFPVLAEDLDEAAETTVTLVLRQNVDQETRKAAGHNANVGDRMTNKINNIAIKGGTMDSVEFLNAPEAFKAEITYDDIVVPHEFFNKRISGGGVTDNSLVHNPNATYKWIDGETDIEVMSLARNGTETGNFATDGYGLDSYNVVLDHYNYVTVYMYVDDPEYKTAGKKTFFNIYQLSGGATSIESTYEVVPNAWQRIPISLANAQAKAQPLEAVKQIHFRPLGNGTATQTMDGVTVYLEKVVFSAEDPGYWADLEAKVTKIEVNGEYIEGYNINTFEYNVVLPFGTTELPTVTVDTNITEAVVDIKQADAVDGTATVTLKGATEADDIVYTINFSVFDGIKLNGFTVGNNDVAIADGKTEYVIALPTGTTEVPEVVADFEGDPAKITVEQATSLDGAATITLDDGTVYTITFFVLPSLEEKYEGAKIVYVSEAGAGAKDGTSIDNAYAKLNGALAAEAATEGQVVFAVLDDVMITSNGDLTHPKNFVITSAGGAINATSHPSFKTNGGANIVIEDIDIYHTNTKGIDDEIYIVAKGNDLTLKNVKAIPYGEKDGKARTAKLYVQPGGDGGSFTKTEVTKLTVENVTGITIRGGGYGGTKMAGGLEYVIGGASEVDYIQASGHSVSSALTDKPENKTINGDVKVTVKDQAKLTSASAGNASIVNGDMYYYVEDEATVGQISFGASSGAGSVEGNSYIYITGGKVDKIAAGNNAKKAKVVVVDGDNAVLGEDVSGYTHFIKYTGNGVVTASADAEGAVTITLESETAQWAEVTSADGTVKKYDMATDEEVVLAHDMAIAIAEGTTTVVFNEGTDVTFKAYEADGAMVDSEEAVTGVAGMAVTAPAAPAAKVHFNFIGWALEGDETKTLVTDFGAFTDGATPVVYVAVFDEDSAVQFKASVEDGASEAMDETIYGLAGTTFEAPAAPAAAENYTLLGWAKEGTTEIVTTFDAIAEEKVVYVAIYDEDPYAIFKVEAVEGVVEALETKVYGTIGTAIVAPEVNTKEHFTLLGWALEGTTDIIENLVYGDVDNTYVAVIAEDPKFTVTIIDGEETVADLTVTDYTGFTYEFEALAHTTTTRFVGYATNADATEAEYFAGDEITVTGDVTFYAVRKEIVLEDAEYTFYGDYDFSDEQYIIEMYYEGPKANMTAFGLAYPAAFEVEYSDEFQTTGTHKVSGEGYYTDVVYPTSGGSFGDNLKTPVLVATITIGMTAEEYASAAYEAFVKYDNDADITGAYADGQWQYIKNDENFSLDVASRVYPIFFAPLADDKDITITVEGDNAEITTVTYPTEGKMLEAIEFTAVTAENEVPGIVSYYVDGVAMSVLEAAEDGITYTIPAEYVLGDVVIEFSYGEPILEVAITEIEAPAAQGTPDTEAVAGEDVNFTIDSVVWEPEVEEFGFDTAYTVKVQVTSEEGFAFSGKTVYTINGEVAKATRIDRDTVELSFTFEKTVEELGNLTVSALLAREEDKAAYANFGKITVLDAEGTEVASYTEGTEEGNTLATEATLLAGIYTVKVEKNGYLTYTEEVEVVYNETTAVEVELIAGDLAQAGDNGVITLLDFGAIVSAFTTETTETDADALAAYRAAVDIDEDGIVTVFDLMFVKANFGATVDTYFEA